MAVIRTREGAPERPEALQRLAAALGDLHRMRGRPSTRALASDHHISHDTVHRVLRCEKRPQWPALETVVRALAGELAEFRTLWDACEGTTAAGDRPSTGRQSRIPARTAGPEPVQGVEVRWPDQWDEWTRWTDRNRRPRIASTNLLDTLTPTVRDGLLALGVTRRLPGGRRLLRQGDSDTHIEIVRDGWVKVTTLTANGPEVLTGIKGVGALLGAESAVTGEPRAYSVTAGEDSIVSTVIRQPHLLGFMKEYSEVSAAIIKQIGRDLRESNRRHAQQLSLPVTIRLAAVLSDLAHDAGAWTPQGGLQISVPVSQRELAQLVGASPATTQKALWFLRSANLVQTGYRRILVADPESLDRLAHGPDYDV
ncbi:Crp/Fnr family transcriptional regulator [Actinoplanes subglobosus]|uniref:Crp/Fnr family transcriptional regulator n=1 Tax=Actinoplanes subglobosus TaxID=1547892 RepID=A0ABV8IUP9_9ACTN